MDGSHITSLRSSNILLMLGLPLLLLLMLLPLPWVLLLLLLPVPLHFSLVKLFFQRMIVINECRRIAALTARRYLQRSCEQLMPMFPKAFQPEHFRICKKSARSQDSNISLTLLLLFPPPIFLFPFIADAVTIFAAAVSIVATHVFSTVAVARTLA